MICPHCGKSFTRSVAKETRDNIKELSKQGYSLRDIEAITGVSFSNVGRILRANDPAESTDEP